MKLNIDKTNSTQGLLRKKEIHSVKVTVILEEEEKQALLDFYNPKDKSTNGIIMSYYDINSPKHKINIWLGWVADSVKKGKDFSWTFNAGTAIDREGFLQDFVQELKTAKDIFMANAAASGTGSSEIEL